MLNLRQRIHIINEIKNYIDVPNPSWENAKRRASENNAWFIPEFIDNAVNNISRYFLRQPALNDWIQQYAIPEENVHPFHIGITMAGNIPLAGFHDFLCCFLTGNRQTVKLSSKDDTLLKRLVDKMIAVNEQVAGYIHFSDSLKGCDAYIATGSNNTARYFEYYFRKYPHIIRKNRTSIAVIKGNETSADLENLADDVCLYFGLGCRNVTKIYVPEKYDFSVLLNAFRKYDFLMEHHKYKHNYDYQLTLQILNQKYYMTNGSLLLIEAPAVFSPISVLHYEYYATPDRIYQTVNPEEIQTIVGSENTPMGTAQSPRIDDYADGIDTMSFLQQLHSKPA